MRRSTILLLAAVFAVFPCVALAQEAAPSAANQANLCEGTYALCIKAPCSPIPTLERLANYGIEQALCVCDVVKGWSMGPGSCADRAPVQAQGRTYLISTYSNLYNDKEKTLACNDPKTLWAWCYGAPCAVDEKEPKKAVCNCPVQQGPARTLGGNCQQDACSSLWSAATPAGDVFANQHYYETMTKEHPQVPVNKPAPQCTTGNGN